MVASRARPAAKKLKLGDILRDAFPTVWRVGWLGDHACSVLSRLSRCGTGELGQLQFACGSCGAEEWRPLGCQDRHCPSCGVRKAEAWAAARVEELIEAPYFHLVFTVPGELYDVFRDNPEELYGLFFSTVSETLATFAKDPRFLGGTPSTFMVLHTTNRQLGYHPHLHVVTAGAAFDEATGRLVRVRKDDFLFPVRALAASFRGRFLSALRELAQADRLLWARPSIRHLADPDHLKALLSTLFAKSWQVRTDAIAGGAERVIRYLARYTYRTAISNARLVRYESGEVTYTWRDRKTGARRGRTLPLLEFVRRFAEHILPKGFRRIRFYGLLSPAKRGTVLVKAQAEARHLSRLRGLPVPVACSLEPEKPPAMCCTACGAEDLRAVAVLRGSTFTVLNPHTYALPPPPTGRLQRREAS